VWIELDQLQQHVGDGQHRSQPDPPRHCEVRAPHRTGIRRVSPLHHEPLKSGAFKSLLRHKLAVIKASAAAVFVVHELKLASAAAQASPLLRTLVPQLAVLSSGFTAALGRLKAGTFKPHEIESALPGIESIKGAAAAAGVVVSEKAPALP